MSNWIIQVKPRHKSDNTFGRGLVSLDIRYLEVRNKKLIRRWDSEHELFYDDIMHILQSTVDSPINMKLWHTLMLHRVYCKPEAKKEPSQR